MSLQILFQPHFRLGMAGSRTSVASPRARKSASNDVMMIRLSLFFFAFAVFLAQLGCAAHTGTGAVDGLAQVSISPTPLSFGTVQSGSYVTKSEQLENTGNLPIFVFSTAVHGAGFDFNCPNLPLELKPQSKLSCSVGFRPQAPAKYAGNIIVWFKWRATDDSDNSKIGGPQNDQPTGSLPRGERWKWEEKDVPLAAVAASSGELRVSSGAINFGDVTVGNTQQQVETLYAAGGPVTLSSATVDNAEFAMSGISLPVTIPSGSTTSLIMAFRPESPGTATGALTLESSAINSSAQVPITGTGTGTTGNGPPQTPPPAPCTDTSVHCLADCNNKTVLNAVASAAEGDTIILPVCTASWTQGVKLIAKHVNIIGQGVGQTVITDNIDKTSACTRFGNMVPVIEIDDSTSVPGYGSILVPSATPNMASPIRISGMTIQTGIVSPNSLCTKIHVLSGSHQLRIDHIEFDGLQRNDGAIDVDGDVWGVLDHITTSGPSGEPILIRTDMWGAVGAYGDNSWAQPSTYGTLKQVTVEDSRIGSNGSLWCEYGSRCTVRYSSLSSMVTHGTDSLGRYRSGRHMEAYHNSFTCDPNIAVGEAKGVPWIHSFRGGTIFFWENNLIRDGSSACVSNPNYIQFDVNYYRAWQRFPPWGRSNVSASNRAACDGTGVFDSNVPAVATGSAAAGSGKDILVVSPSPNWTTNQWQGYMLHDATGAGAPVTAAGGFCSGPPPAAGGPPTGTNYSTTTGPWGSFILSNTANTITTESSSYDCTQGGYHMWTVGDTYEIHPLGKCLDNVGLGMGARLDGGYNGVHFTCTAGGGGQTCSAPIAGQTCAPGDACGWVNEESDPLYSWHNTINSTTKFGIGIKYGAANPAIKFNREVYNENDSFNGSGTVGSGTDGGVGVGPLAQRPATCTPQVGYWATDQQILYQCSAPNAWTVHYQPLAYPHPFTLLATMSKQGRVIETADGHVLVSYGGNIPRARH